MGSAFREKMITLERLTELQSDFQFGTRVLTPNGHKGIVNFFSKSIDSCRVFYDCDPDVPLGNAEIAGIHGCKTRREMFKISECKILSVEEAMDV